MKSKLKEGRKKEPFIHQIDAATKQNRAEEGGQERRRSTEQGHEQHDIFRGGEGGVARKLKLRSETEWREWSKSGLRFPGMPSSPDRTYRGDGWVSWPDWLGNGGTSHNNMLPFDVARVIARKLKLRTVKEWHEWSKSGLRPPGMPSNPDRAYRGNGWVSYPDWLGYGPTRPKAPTGGKRKRLKTEPAASQFAVRVQL